MEYVYGYFGIAALVTFVNCVWGAYSLPEMPWNFKLVVMGFFFWPIFVLVMIAEVVAFMLRRY